MNVEERTRFIKKNKRYYEYCQKILYKSEDPYHLPYKTLPEFLFYHYLDSNVMIIDWVYNNYNGVTFVNKFSLYDKCNYSVIKNGYLPTIKWIYRNDLIAMINNYFISACSYGHLEMAQYIYKIGKEQFQNTNYIYFEVYRLACLGDHINIIIWLQDTINIPLNNNMIEYLIKELKIRKKEDTKSYKFLLEKLI